MRSLYIVLLVGLNFLFAEVAKAQQWFTYSPTSGFDINAVDILKPGWIVTGGGGYLQGNSIQVMFSSPDYGVTWIENPHDGYFNWNNSIAFSDTLNGFGVGLGGRIINSGDGGLSWPNVNTVINRNFNKIIGLTPQVYYAVGGQQSNDSIQTIIKSTDGGLVWNVVYDTAGPWLKSVYFINTLNGFAVGDSGVILNTINGGTTWNPVAAPILRNFEAITFINADTGFIAGGSQALGRSTILQTVNGGITWNVLSDNTGGILNDISFANDTEGYIVGDSATVLKTTNAGSSWLPQLISASLTGSETFRAVKFYDRNFGVIGGRAGLLYVYTGWPLDLFTLGPVLLDSADVQVSASINTHNYPEALNFVYSTDSTFASYQSTQVQSYTLDTFLSISVQLSGLTPNTWYYYFASAGTKTGDTLSFFTGTQPLPLFVTDAGSDIDSVTLKLNGEVHGITPVTDLVFEYGITPYLGSTIAATPATINDAADHPITAVLSGVQPFTIYYYRLRGVSGIDTLRGDIYFTGTLYHVLQTLPATYITDSGATLNGQEQGFPYPVALGFEYWQKNGPHLPVGMPFNFASSDTLRTILGIVNGLQPRQFYHYRITSQSSSGISYGNTQLFYTGAMDSLIQTLPAQSATPTSAMLKGKVNGFSDSATLSFDYGTDSSFGNTLQALPPVVTDSLYHGVSALFTGVPINTEYYYRLKAVLSQGDTVYGDVQQLYLGNDIPNWDFQNWTSKNYSIPQGWNFLGGQFNRVAGHSGNYALNITGVTLATLNSLPNPGGGGPLQPPFYGGKPFTGRPDSITLYVNASIAPGDSAVFLLLLFNKATAVAAAQDYITSTANSFQRISVPLTYFSSLAPDSMQLEFSSTSPNRTGPIPGVQNNSLTIDDIAFVPATAPIYNGDFETWFDINRNLPDHWFSTEFMFLDSTRSNYQQVTQTFFNPPFDFAASVNDVPVGIAGNGVRWGSMGLDSFFLYSGRPTFSVNARHYTLNGYYKSLPVNGDSVVVEVTIYSGNNVVGSGFISIGDTVPEFTPFSIPIRYGFPNDSTGNPDGGDIKIVVLPGPGTSGAATTHFIFDKLHFDGFAVDTSNYLSIVSIPSDQSGIKVYPNPTRDLVVVEIESPATVESTIQIYGLNGQRQKELKLPAGEQKISFSVDELTAGIYVVEWVNGDRAVNKKIVVIK